MPFQYILANLMAETDAVGVLFLDELGETVDVSCSEFSLYEMRIVGAYLGIYLRQLGSFLKSQRAGASRMIHIEKEKLHIYAVALPDEYYLVLVQRPPALVARAQRQLARAANELARELF